ncbi:autotransporter outer membrane beta-barrel domain-containing protein [Avibacterium avium]|uniref:autotransporter outer membrane beta-barrel domain-containing protein n=1 Tax=Avibacterium avium TaxID=751 RepID=UPI003BF7AE1E
MNKIYKVKFNVSTGIYHVCSELAKGKTKSKVMRNALCIVTSLGIASFAQAAPLPAATITNTQTLTLDANTTAFGGGNLLIGRNGDLTINGETTIQFSPNKDRVSSKPVNWVYAVFSGANTPQATGKLTVNDNMTLDYVPFDEDPAKSDAKGGSRIGVIANYNTDFTFNKNLAVHLDNLISSGDRAEHYGIQAGSGNDYPDNLGYEHFNRITIKGNYDASLSLANPSDVHTLAGIRSIGGAQYDRQGRLKTKNSSGLVTIDGDTTLLMNGAYAEGIYVSGGQFIDAGEDSEGKVSKVVLNNSDITMKNGLSGSAALKIGKSRNIESENKGKYSYGAGAGIIESKGKMKLDTTESDGSAIQMAETGSKFIANFDNSSSFIRSKGSALEIGATDWTTHNASNGIKAYAKNANWQSVSDDVDLIKVSHKQTDVDIQFTGSETDLQASSDGYLINVADSEANVVDRSSVEMLLSEGKMTGLTHKGEVSSLNLILENGANWYLKEKRDGDKIATFDTTSLLGNSVIHAYNAGKAEFTLKGILAGENNGTGEVSSNTSTITMQDNVAGDRLTIDANYQGNDAKLLLDTVLAFDDAKTDFLHIQGNATGDTEVAITNVQGAGAMTNMGIKVIQVDGNPTKVEGEKTDPTLFTLKGTEILVGEDNRQKFGYKLYQGSDAERRRNIVAVSSDEANDWFLRSRCVSGSHIVSGTSAQYDGLGCISNDDIVVDTAGSVDLVEGAGGRDNITILGKVNGDVFGDGSGIDSSAKQYIDGNGNTIELTDAEMDSLTSSATDKRVNFNDSIIIKESAVVSGSVNAGVGDDRITVENNAVIGKLNAGLGSDTAMISSRGYDGSQVLDGGDDVSTSDGMVDTLNLNGINVSANGGNIQNWEVINLQNNTRLNLEGNLVTGNESTTGLMIDSSSTVASSSDNVVVTGNVNNQGVIDLHKNNFSAGQSLLITGDYIGGAGSSLVVDGIWNDPNNLTTDTLHINGIASGETSVVVKEKITGNVTQDRIEKISNNPVVIVDTEHNGNAFVGVADTIGAGQAQLKKVGNNYYWALQADGKDIYDPFVSVYAQMPKANLELGYNSIGSLHDRRGENQALAWDACGCVQKNAHAQTWVRLLGNKASFKGKERFDFDMKQFGIQVGHDFALKYNPENHSRRHTGAYLSYQVGDMNFFDRYRAVNGVVASDKYTGQGKSHMASLGIYNTYYRANGSYLDLVGQIGYLNNKYQPRDHLATLSQNGLALGLSAEVGRPYQVTKNWLLEPQAQLIYQYLNLQGGSYHDKYIKPSPLHGIRGRIGVRLAHNSNYHQLTRTVYFTANILHDVHQTDDVQIGNSQVSERYNPTWWEIGVGGQIPVSARSYLYGSMKYERNFNGEKRDGYKANIGYKYTW